MHIPDNYLSPSTCAVMAAAFVPALAVSIKKVKEEVPKEKIPLLGIGAAFSFVAMMFNIPMVGGTTGHAVCGTLIAILLGPYSACLSVTVALALQALLFGDGGILSLGANCFNMAFVLPFVGYALYKFISSKIKGSKGRYIGGAVGSYAGLNVAALLAAIEFGVQPLLFTDSAGNAMYCPYDLSVSIPAMAIGHLTIFGLAEIVFTTGILAFTEKTAPGLLNNSSQKKSSKPLTVLLGLLMLATPLGLLAAGTAWGEWDEAQINSLTGFTPQGFVKGFSFDALMPDYTVASIPEWLGYIISAGAGIAILVILFKIIASFRKERPTSDK